MKNKTKIIDKLFIIFCVICLLFVSKFKIIIGSGVSMYPTIKDKAILLCERKNNYKVNDIVLYKIGGKNIIHRIIEIKEQKLKDNSIIRIYTIKGDNNDSADMFNVYDENIVCKIKKY